VGQSIVYYGRSAVIRHWGQMSTKKPTATGAIGSSKGETMTLEELLRSHPNGRFYLKTQRIAPDVHIIIHPDGEDGKTLDYVVVGNELVPLLDMTKDVLI
jgi:hypothetical protein